MADALRRVGWVVGAVVAGLGLALAAQPVLLTQLAGRLVDQVP